MGRSVDDLELFMSVVQQYQFNLDKTIPPLKWQSDVYHSKAPLKIGYYVEDNFFQTSRSCARAVEEVVEALRKRGYDVVPFTPPRVAYAAALYMHLMSADQQQNLLRMLANEDVDPVLSTIFKLFHLPMFIVNAAFAVLRLLGKARFVDISSKITQHKTVFQHWESLRALDSYRLEFLTAMDGLDVLVVPGGCTPAVTHKNGQHVLATLESTYLYNLINLPCGVVPVTRVTPADVKVLRQPEKDPWDTYANSFDRGSEGLPVGVQVVGHPWEDEKVLRVMKEVEHSFPFTETIYTNVREKILSSH